MLRCIKAGTCNETKILFYIYQIMRILVAFKLGD